MVRMRLSYERNEMVMFLVYQYYLYYNWRLCLLCNLKLCIKTLKFIVIFILEPIRAGIENNTGTTTYFNIYIFVVL